MSEAIARAALDRVFETPSDDITIEFQGGEPLLAFPMVRLIVLEAEQRAAVAGKAVSFSITTTLHHATDEVLAFFRDHQVAVSTSFDGPAAIHDQHRVTRQQDSHARTLKALDRTRAVLGHDAVNALTTVTRSALGVEPQQVIPG